MPIGEFGRPPELPSEVSPALTTPMYWMYEMGHASLIPGRAAPVLVTEEMVKSMKAGSVIIDLAAAQGGNCPLTEADRTVVKHGVTLVGETNLPALVAADASALYARNVLDFLKLIIDKEGKLHINREDDIVVACLVAHEGAVTRK